MLKHTPGPWRIGNITGTVVADHSIPTDGRVTGHNDTDYYGGHLIAESIWRREDSELIAAAPELLEVVVEFIKYFDDEVHSPDFLENARKVVKKARGEEDI